MQIHNYNDFLIDLNCCGFSMAGGNSEGIYSIIPWDWNETPPYETAISWHTGDPETDPWAWHLRAMDEKPQIAVAKLFFNKSGYITSEWYPYFLAARRNGLTFDEQYDMGKMGQWEKRIYECICDNKKIAYHNIKAFTGFNADEKSKFERAITSLQMKMFITGCGKEQKLSKTGEAFGWPSVVFCTTEDYMGDNVFNMASNISLDEAVAKISEQVYKINPGADKKKILKFIKG